MDLFGKHIIKNLEQLEVFVENLALKLKLVKPPFYLLLFGELGAGKTTLTKLLLKKLGVQEPVTSPTFVILNTYATQNLQINHMDAYRLTNGQDLDMYFEMFAQGLNIIEWPNNLKVDWSNYQCLTLRLTILDEKQRKIVVE